MRSWLRAPVEINMGNTLRAKFAKTGVAAIISALVGALTFGLIGIIIPVVVVATGMNTETSSAAQKDWFPIVAIFWGLVGGIGGAIFGALLGCITGIVISRMIRKRDQR